MSRRKLLTAVALAVGVLGVGFAVAAAIDFAEGREFDRLERMTPNLGFYFRGNGDAICFEVQFIRLDEATSLTWEQLQVKEYTPEGPSWTKPDGVAGEVKVGDSFCGYRRDSYYDFIYLPTGFPTFFTYPGCGGNPEAHSARSSCNPPREWPRE